MALELVNPVTAPPKLKVLDMKLLIIGTVIIGFVWGSVYALKHPIIERPGYRHE